MSKTHLPSPGITLSKIHARRFLLAHLRLWPPRRLEGKARIMDFVRPVGCIQFGSTNVVGHNPDLVLQSRVMSESTTSPLAYYAHHSHITDPGG